MDKDYVEEVEGYFEKQLERVNSWLSFAEAKNAGLFAANIAILVVVIGLFNTVPVFCVVAGIITMASSVSVRKKDSGDYETHGSFQSIGSFLSALH